MLNKNFIYTFFLIALALMPKFSYANQRANIIENFEAGNAIELFSYADQDSEPELFMFDIDNTFTDSSHYSLKLFGNTWKTQPITPILIDTNTVWQVASYQGEVGDSQGFGI